MNSEKFSALTLTTSTPLCVVKNFGAVMSIRGTWMLIRDIADSEPRHARSRKNSLPITLAFAEMNKVLTWDHQGVPIIPSARLSPETLAAIHEVSEVETKTGHMLIKVKLYSKQAALDCLTRYLQMLDIEERVKALEDAMALRGANRWH
jgi:hypothetical protein